jgi:hypothetical protein
VNKEHEERALAILKLLKGMRIDQAQELLSWCGGCLLRQPVVEWSRTEEDCANHEPKETHETACCGAGTVVNFNVVNLIGLDGALQKAEEIRKIRPDVEIRITLSQQVIR